jgi:GT2 family glycosyltransferase
VTFSLLDKDSGHSTLRSKAEVRAAVRPVVVTGVLVVHNGAPWLKECLDGLSLQVRPLDRLVIVDTGSTDGGMKIVQGHARIRQVVGDVVAISAPAGSTFGEAVALAAEQTTSERVAAERMNFEQMMSIEQMTPERVAAEQMSSGSASPESAGGWLWLLHDDSAATPQALLHLLDAARRSPSVGVAGPKLVTWQDPSRLLEVGAVITRSGRRVGGPAPGEPDQGQHDHRSDVLGVSTSGMLIRRDVFVALGGFDPAFRQSCDDLDLCWRAQLAGYRVVVAPRARMREAAASTNGQRSSRLSAAAAQGRVRRHGRQVALARCSPYAAPFLAIWIALASVGSAAALLVAKRPREAWAALGDFASLLTPWRPLAARWRSRGIRRVRRRDLRGLFASPRVGFRTTVDSMHEGVGGGSLLPVDDAPRSTRSLESGPASEEAESLETPARGAASRILRHPGFLAVMAAGLVSVLTWRSLFGALDPTGLGLTGGELLPASGNASELWHTWLDGWHGPGLGNALESPPYLPVLAAGAWVVEHLPLIGAPSSSIGVSISWLMGAAIPLSAWTAYLGSRVVIRAPWPRAWAALAWASLATLTTAVGTGRLGAVVAHILLPLVAAGFVCAARRSTPSSATFAAAVALAATGAFNPALAVVGALAALVLLVLGHGRTRLRAAILLLVPIGLLGPWIPQLVHNPLLLLGGPGLTVWRGVAAAPWQLELLHPGGPGSYPAWLSAPIVLAGVIAISRREVGSRAMWILAVLAAGGLAMGVASSHVIIARIPQDLAGAGLPITVWAGTGLDLAALALVAAALRGFGRASERLELFHFGWRQTLFPVVVAASVLGVVASMAIAAWSGVGQALTPQAPNVPAVAADQAHGPLGNRLLTISRDADTIGFRLQGAEPGPLVRDLPVAVVAQDPTLNAAVKTTVGTGDSKSANAARGALADLGVGFVTFQGASGDPLVTQLDATAGMTRLSNNKGLILWRVLPRDNTLGSSRLRLVDAEGVPVASVAVTGDHGQTKVDVGPATLSAAAGGRRLVVAEPNRWADHARVTFAGARLAPVAGAEQPTYRVPDDAGQLDIALAPTRPWWRWAQLGLLLLVLFLAAPFGSPRAARRTS